MKIDGVQCSDGSQLDLTMFEPKSKPIGYQIEHKETGRILPTTTSFQLYGQVAATIKLIEVAEAYKIDSADYNINPVYRADLEGSYILIMHSLDEIKKGM